MTFSELIRFNINSNHITLINLRVFLVFFALFRKCKLTHK